MSWGDDDADADDEADDDADDGDDTDDYDADDADDYDDDDCCRRRMMAVTGGLRLCAPIEYSIIFTSRRLKPGINKKRNCG